MEKILGEIKKKFANKSVRWKLFDGMMSLVNMFGKERPYEMRQEKL